MSVSSGKRNRTGLFAMPGFVIIRTVKRLPLFFTAVVIGIVFAGACPAAQPPPASVPEAGVRYLPAGEYFPALNRALQSAQTSIIVVMNRVYLSTPERTPLVQQLVQELVSAQRRGIEVQVVLDRYRDVVQGRPLSSEVRSNDWAFRWLTDSGIAVAYADASLPLNAKMVIVDGKAVLLGNSEWTQESLAGAGVQADVLIEDEAVAQAALCSARAITYSTETRPAAEMAVVPVPVSFIEYVDLLPRMLARRQSRAFDVYLLLLWQYGVAHQSLFTVNLDAVSRELGLENELGAAEAREQVLATLQELQDTYWLLSLEHSTKDRAQVRLIDYDDPALDYAAPHRLFVLLPEMYWRGGWSHKLDLTEKACLLYTLVFESASTSAPWWFMDEAAAVERFNVPQSLIRDGFRQLQRYGLLRRQAESAAEAGPAAYRRLPLFDLDALYARFDRLAQQHGTVTVQRAREMAELADRMYDADAVTEIIGWMLAMGEGRVAEAFQTAARAGVPVSYPDVAARLRQMQ